MNAAVQKGDQGLQTLPRAAFASPLAFEVALDWSQLAGAPREILDGLFEGGRVRFPDYLPLYTTRAYQLLPRWFGAPGEWEAMAKKCGDTIGGENGDVFYARIAWSLWQSFPNMPEESNFNYERARRGLEILQKRRPDSISVASARLDIAYESKDWKTVKQVLTTPQGHVIDNGWWMWKMPRDQAIFAELRMGILGDAIH